MANTRRAERRHLTDDEAALVDKSHYPALKDLADGELGDVLGQLRERRDRARTIAERQRREMRGKAAPAGARAASDDRGTRQKVTVLSAAVQRLNKEQTRRRSFAARAALVDNAERALEMRQAAFRPSRPGPGRTAGKGMRAKPSSRRERIAEPMEVGRVSQFVKAGQARRDSR
ncbi:hypothetical protein [Mongoliimonas terrestris]|uniref:hypothetical protein n=1 Tax=Mongoliimonas terrestris TaxID=1709001 RepID=UPI000949863D|nr:hypothetical protein [Mongoliimonas terrestris]